MPERQPPDEHLASPAAERNKAPILAVLQRALPTSGLVLEIASGTGQHTVHFAQALTALRWQPSDPDAEARRSITAQVETRKLANVSAPVDLDVRNLPWAVPTVDAIVCINMIHIAPWAATTALFAGARLAMRDAGVLFLYGPYKMRGSHTAPNNQAFDKTLRAQNPAWGVRDLDDVVKVANAESFDLVETVAMPANNFSVVFRKRETARA